MRCASAGSSERKDGGIVFFEKDSTTEGFALHFLSLIFLNLLLSLYVFISLSVTLAICDEEV